MKTELTTLANGIRVVTEAAPHLESASIGVFIDAGARYESAELNGISHLLEHMLFKGTRRRSARQIAEEIEAVGGHLNAYTSRDHTTYYARVLKDHIPLAVDVLADLLQNSVFDAGELQREKEVIIQEIGQVEDTPDDIVFDRLQEVAFPDQPLGRSILGKAENVRGFTPDRVRNWRDTHYRGRNMVIAAAGSVDHDTIVKLSGDAFGDIPAECEAEFAPARYGGGEVHGHRELEQLHIAFGFPGVAYLDEEYYAAQVFSTLVGGGMSSRLFQEVREDRGLAYSVYTFGSSHIDTGLFGIYAGTSPQVAGELMEVTAAQMQAVREQVTEDEIARARAQLKAGLLMSLESSASRIEQMGRQMLIFDRVLPIEEMVGRVDMVDAAAVAEVCRRTLAGPLSLATMGPTGSLQSFGEIELLFAEAVGQA